MAWLKGVRTDGFIKIDENVNFRGTVVGAGDGHMRPYGALDYYVDGTDGSDTYSGKSWEGAFKTIQAAITAQIAATDSKGDVIWVAPGAYAESLTGNLTKVQIIGTTCGGNPHAVSIRPTTSYSYTGSMTDSAIRNIMLMSPNTSSKDLPAVLLDYMGYSVIDNCTFIGADATCVEGLQIGPTADNATVTKCDFSQITNNTFGTFYGVDKSFTYGIKLGPAGASSYSSAKQIWQTLIAGNTILADTAGIWITSDADNSSGTVFRDNYIASMNSYNGPAIGIGAGDTSYQCLVVKNYIIAVDAIQGFPANCVLDNWVGESGTAKVEGPAQT